jgi:hypothetical protein
MMGFSVHHADAVHVVGQFQKFGGYSAGRFFRHRAPFAKHLRGRNYIRSADHDLWVAVRFLSRYWAVWPSVLGGGGNGLPHRQEAVRNDGAGRGVLFDFLICERWRRRDLDRWPLGCHAAKGRLAMAGWGGALVFFLLS